VTEMKLFPKAVTEPKADAPIASALDVCEDEQAGMRADRIRKRRITLALFGLDLAIGLPGYAAATDAEDIERTCYEWVRAMNNQVKQEVDSSYTFLWI